jgi:uncharacterized protein (TIGR02271 family)
MTDPLDISQNNMNGEVTKGNASVDDKRVLNTNEEIIIPVLAEELHIEKELFESGKVRIVKKINEEKSTVEVSLNHDEVNVERKLINEYVDADTPDVRYEGDTMIVSVLKEVVVVQKKIILVEELRITKIQQQEIYKEDITLKTEHVSIECEDLTNK